jgi:uncharacterized protein YecT (DUF1311 family)
MRSKTVGLFMGILLLMVQYASAQTVAPAKPLCENAKTQLEINECMAAAYKAADAELNSLYVSLQGKPGAVTSEKLRAAQRAWIKYRDANCDAEAELYEGGSIRPAMYSGCLERVTRARIAELHAIYDTGTR